jgi:hypothetical protein
MYAGGQHAAGTVEMPTLGCCSLVLVAASCPLVSACTFGCTLVGGRDGLIVDVQVTGGTLPPGAYTIIARVEDVELRLEETLSGGSATLSESPEVVVDGKHLVLEGVVFSEGGTIQVGFIDRGGPAEVTIEVWRGTVMLAQETYAPKYTEFRPNGDHCPPELAQARGSLVVAAPSS